MNDIPTRLATSLSSGLLWLCLISDRQHTRLPCTSPTAGYQAVKPRGPDVGQSAARDPGTNGSAAAKTNTQLFAWYWGIERAYRGEGEGDEMRKGGSGMGGVHFY